MDAPRLFTIFDIHGQFELLSRILRVLFRVEKMDLTKDRLIFVGDYIDRGPDSAGVIDLVMALHHRWPDNVVPLLGNHEDMCLCAHRPIRRWSDHEFARAWMHNGGYQTNSSYPNEKIPESHLAWMESLPVSHREHGFFISHATIPAESRRYGNQGNPPTRDEMLWERVENEKHGAYRFSPESDGTPVVGVCGHTPKRTRYGWRARIYPNYIFGDTGAGKSPKCPLCCIELRSRKEIYIYPEGVYVPPDYRIEIPE